MSMFATILASHGGDKVAAGVEVAVALMSGDAIVFKAGYTAVNAILAAQKLYDLDTVELIRVSLGVAQTVESVDP